MRERERIQLIVNADDLGLHPRIDSGILEAHRRGIVTSATLLVMGSNAEAAVAAARTQKLPLGVHLCLSTHLPPAAKPSAVPHLAPGGRMRGSWLGTATAWLRGAIPAEEIERELRAQLERAIALGAQPDHLDGHQHLHLLPGLAPRVARLAREARLPLRWPAERPRWGWLRRPGPCAKSMLLSALARVSAQDDIRRVPAVGLFEAGALTEARLLALIEGLGEGVTEIGCHPGAEDVRVPEDPTWRYPWRIELEALCSPKVRKAVVRRGIALVSYRDLG